jgi:hypothetical protein
MIHNTQILGVGDALHHIQQDIDLLKTCFLIFEYFEPSQFVQTRDELLLDLLRMAIDRLENNVSEALENLGIEDISEIRLSHQAMLESNLLSVDKKSPLNGSDG